MSKVLSILRPAQWIKNLILFAPIVFGQQLAEPRAVWRVVLAFAGFCLVSSAGYVLNGIMDRATDAAHPTKRHRPLASGRVSVGSAAAVLVVVLAAGLSITAWSGLGVLAWALAYSATNAAYCLWLKHVVILDVMAIAAGFVLRMLAGSAAAAVEPSQWLLLCTMLASVFLGFTKRRAELTHVGAVSPTARAVLEHYSLAFLDQMIAIVTSATVICYVLYTVSVETLPAARAGAMVLTVPFVLYGIFRYLYLVYHCDRGESPTRTIVTDAPLLVNALLWGVVCALIIYGG